MSDKILVTGATGNVGRELIRQLNLENANVVAGVRDPHKAKEHGWEKVDLVEFDYERPETVDVAMEGIDKVFLVAPPVRADNDKLLGNAIDAAQKAGVKHIVDLSAMGVEHSESPMRNIELHLIKSGVPYTILRPNWFMQNFITFLHDSIANQGGVYLPAGDSKTSFIDIRDVAEVAKKALLEDGHQNKEYTLTGDEPLTYHDAINAIGDVSGKELKYVPLEEDKAREMMLSAGWPEPNVDGMLYLYGTVRQGYAEPVAPETEHLLGRKPITFKRFAEDYSDRWK